LQTEFELLATLKTRALRTKVRGAATDLRMGTALQPTTDNVGALRRRSAKRSSFLVHCPKIFTFLSFSVPF
jgi:hypothetical protein